MAEMVIEGSVSVPTVLNPETTKEVVSEVIKYMGDTLDAESIISEMESGIE